MPTPALPLNARLDDPATKMVTRVWGTLFAFWHRAIKMSGIGYVQGAGGTVTQATSKATGVTLNKATGQITLNDAALASDTTVSFTFTNSTIEVADLLLLNHVSGGTAGAYLLNAQAAAGSASIAVRNVTLASLSEAIVIGFALIKGQTV